MLRNQQGEEYKGCMQHRRNVLLKWWHGLQPALVMEYNSEKIQVGGVVAIMEASRLTLPMQTAAR